ncbi:hypothetical protein AVEN_111137-1 [Araneus ventricosus]|uniref:Uncharacterized protein n=1 Tax=Araneus ventricosus TaxID=182803 RepID=A0A4Y2C7F7_ARAVE|nr:hypothetical protein AVEN_111137-1 [Araneus ventricosus]
MQMCHFVALKQIQNPSIPARVLGKLSSSTARRNADVMFWCKDSVQNPSIPAGWRLVIFFHAQDRAMLRAILCKDSMPNPSILSAQLSSSHHTDRQC